VYFCGKFDKPATAKTFMGADSPSETFAEYSESGKLSSSTARLGAIFIFQDVAVVSRVGVSFISTDRACVNMNTEIPEGTALEQVRDDTKRIWEDTVLSKVTTTDDDLAKKSHLYTSLYFMNLLPTNKTGENPLWKSDEPYYDDIFTFWDTVRHTLYPTAFIACRLQSELTSTIQFRCTTPLFHVLQPQGYTELLRSWIDIWRHEGFMSDARSSFTNGAVQGGSNVDNVLADAFVKGVGGGINWSDAFQAMRTNAETTPPSTTDARDPGGSTKEGRGALPDWLEHGFITTQFSRSVSRAVEYSVNDFALYQVARGLGLGPEAERYLQRSHNWRNHWDASASALGHSGFLVPRDEAVFVRQDPLSCGGCYWNDHYYQGLPWEYTLNVHHDLSTLISLAGGPQRFRERLDLTFEPGVVQGNEAWNHTIFNPANEPSFGTPYLYNFVNAQAQSVRRSRFIAKNYYSLAPGGLPGNSDAGAMESWLLWSMIGLYPLTGQATFLIGSPWFRHLSIRLGGGGALEIKTTGGGEDEFYVQSLKVNGQEWNQNWVSWEDIFAKGGIMEFVLGKEPVQWDTGEVPPSPGTELYVAAEERQGAGENMAKSAAPWGVGIGIGIGMLVFGLVILGLVKMRDKKPGVNEADIVGLP
jgi:predicted alpha-1,2-mannosidase